MSRLSLRGSKSVSSGYITSPIQAMKGREPTVIITLLEPSPPPQGQGLVTSHARAVISVEKQPNIKPSPHCRHNLEPFYSHH